MKDLSVSSNDVPPVPPWRSLTLKQVALGTTLVAVTLLAVGLLIALRYVLVLLFLGIVVATALSPLVEWLRGRGLSRTVAVWAVFGTFLGVVIGVLAALVPFFIMQFDRIVSELPERYASLQASLAGSPVELLRGLAVQMPSDPFAGLTGEQGAALGASIAAALPSVGRSVALGLLVLLLSYYWLYYRALAVQSMALLFPLDWRTEAVDLWNQIELKIGAFVRGLTILSIAIAILSAIGYSLIGLPYAIPLALIAGLLEAVPYVGQIITLVVAVAVGLTVSPEMAIQAFIVGNVVQFIESAVVVPRVMDKAVGVRPVVTLLALTIFAELFGVLGALLAVPLAAAFQVLLDRFILRTPAADQLEIGGRDQLALLRYRVQDLASDLRQQFRSKEAEAVPEEDVHEEELELLLLDLDTLLADAQVRK